LLIAVAALVALLAPSPAGACSHDDTAYFETFVDTSCLESPLSSTTLDAQGGVRLATNGVPVTTPWDSDTDFDGGVNFQSIVFPPLGVRTLTRSGTGAAAALGLPATLLPLTPDGANPVLGPTAATVLDGDDVDDPALAKVGSTYYLWYSGTPENGGPSALFLATSSNGTTWARANSSNPVLQPTAGSFDEDGVYGADVVYDPADALAPFRMWYSGRADVFGGIGLATSTDGVTWTKYAGGGPFPVPVLGHGPAGSADSFSAADPSVLKDGSTWKMWYTGDDSSKKRIAYATSADGVTWSKGGKVIAPEDPGVSANIQFGAFAPTVWKTASGYSMLLTGRKLVGGGVFQTKVMGTTSSDGIAWAGPSPTLNPSGSNTNFDFSNLNSPDLLQDSGAASPFKLYYSGNTIDANGNFHTRIGLATSNDGNAFNKVSGASTGGSVLDVGALGTAFDSRQASGLSVAAPAGAVPKLAGVYWGTRGSDFKPRLGEATSADGSSWTKVSVSAPNGGALFGLGNPASFDNGGQRDPSLLYDGGTYDLYFTGLDSGGTRSIGFASTPEAGGTKQPDNSSWSARSQILSKGSSGAFDSAGVSHPSALKDAASSYFLYYAGTDGTVSKIGRATSSAAGGPFTKDAGAVLSVGAAGQFDESGVKDPVVVKAGAGDYRMLYTGLDADGIERVGYATSTNGTSWTKQGVVLNPSLAAYASDESGVEPTGMLVGGSTLHVWTSGVDRTGRTRAEHATTGFPTPGSPQPEIPSGWATYQLGSASTTVRDFRQIARTSSGSAVELWTSFLQPYSSGGNEFWSSYFPVTASSPSEALNFLLTVRGVRWQARLSTPGSAPSLDRVELTNAPVSFVPSGSVTSGPIAAATGRMVTSWTSLVVNTSLFSPAGSGTGSATVRVLDATTGEQLATASLGTGGDTALDLSGISAPAHQSLRLVFDLQSADGQATPRVNSFKVLYATQPAPVVLTLAASAPSVVFGKPVVLTGTLTQGGGALAGQPVTISAQGTGDPAFAPVSSVTTDTAGGFTATVVPTKATTYKATYAGAAEPTVSVTVAHLVTLSVVRKGTKGTFRGRLGPSHPGRLVVIQVKSGSGWKTLAKLKASKSSTFSTVRKLKAHAKYQFRARTAADAQHLAGTSPIVYLDRMKVALALKLSGRKATFSGSVTPAHPGRVVTIQKLVGTSWVAIGRVKLSKRSTFRLVRTLAPGTYDLRAVTAADRDHWGGESRTRHLVVS
jgi:predicted GH43/DUF377 family glycosyl hydrolase